MAKNPNKKNQKEQRSNRNQKGVPMERIVTCLRETKMVVNRRRLRDGEKARR